MTRKKSLATLAQVPPPPQPPKTKNELVAYLRETMPPELFAMFSCAVVSEEVFEHCEERMRELVRAWWSLPNIGTVHVFTVAEKKDA